MNRYFAAKLLALTALAASLSFAQSVTPKIDRPTTGRRAARDYYKQLYEAGGLSNGLNKYACFNDDPDSLGFVVIDATAYDQSYATAFAKATAIMSTKDWQQDREKVDEFLKATKMVDKIQQDSPYIKFLTDDFFQPGVPGSEFFHGGGRILEMSWYSRGVKNGPGDEFHWDGHEWRFQVMQQTSSITETTTYDLSIEPSTMRYLMTLTVTIGDGSDLVPPSSRTKPIQSGSCERIPDGDQRARKAVSAGAQ